MDPNVTLAELRSLVESINESVDGGQTEGVTDSEREFAQFFEALDGWISGGGFLPSAWVKK